MAYKLFDMNNIEVQFGDLQDKGPWCRHGNDKEQTFLEIYGEQFGLILNPEKKTNPLLPDLFDTVTNKLAELKAQNTPFFQSNIRYGINPQYAVVFNLKDQKNYSLNYPDLDIYYWIDWMVVRFLSGETEITIEPMRGIWKINFRQLNKLMKTAPLHHYGQRRYDNKGNAKSSYVLSLEDPNFERLV